jgi:Ca2+/H+ antiporter
MNRTLTAQWLKGVSLMFMGVAILQGIFNDKGTIDWIALIVFFTAALLIIVAANMVDSGKKEK